MTIQRLRVIGYDDDIDDDLYDDDDGDTGNGDDKDQYPLLGGWLFHRRCKNWTGCLPVW